MTEVNIIYSSYIIGILHVMLECFGAQQEHKIGKKSSFHFSIGAFECANILVIFWSKEINFKIPPSSSTSKSKQHFMDL